MESTTKQYHRRIFKPEYLQSSKALKFEIKEGKILNYSADKEVVEDIVNKLP
jgi:hypothetical protein